MTREDIAEQKRATLEVLGHHTLASKQANAVPFAQRLSCTISEACAATGLGRTKLYELIGAGCVDTMLVGRRRLVIVKSLLHLIGPAQAKPARPNTGRSSEQ